MSINDGGPAFPVPQIIGINGMLHDVHGFGGMTLRQWFAGMAMQGMLTSRHGISLRMEVVTDEAFRYADAMLAHEARERAEKETNNG